MKLYLLAGAALIAGAATFAATTGHLCTNCGSSSKATAQAQTASARTINSCWALPTAKGAKVTSASITPVSLKKDGEEAPLFTSYEEAFRQARDENKLVMIDVYTDWCSWCKKLDKDVYTDAEVQKEIKQYFSATKLNAEASTPHSFGGKTQPESSIATVWGVSAYPTIMFVTPDERIVQVVPGYVPAKEFALVLKFVGSGAYKTDKFEDWKKTNG